MSKLVQYQRIKEDYECNVCGALTNYGLFIPQKARRHPNAESMYLCQACVRNVEVFTSEQELRIQCGTK